MKSVRIHPPEQPIDAEVEIPGSKSYTNRALVIGALAEGESTIVGILRSDDTYWCTRVLEALGCEIGLEGAVITTGGLGGHWTSSECDLYVGSAGTAARFLPGALAQAPAGTWRLDASDQMRRRPMAGLVDALRVLGAHIDYEGTPGRMPLEIRGGGLRGGQVQVRGSTSSQFVSGLLLASPYASAPVTVQVVDHIVQHAYVQMTIDLMRRFGALVEHDPDLSIIRVSPGKYRGGEIRLEADASSACYFLALAALTGGNIRISNLSGYSRQADLALLDVLAQMGCYVSRTEDSVAVRGPAELRGGMSVDLREYSDQMPTVAALAPFTNGPIRIAGVAHVRHHECDRIDAMYRELGRLGIRADMHEDGLTVHPGRPRAARLDSHHDHRIAMACTLIGSRVDGIEIAEPECVSKTFASFFFELERVGVGVRYDR